MAKQFQISKHAAERASERGFDPEVIKFVMLAADVKKRARDGRQAVFLSHERLERLTRFGLKPEQFAQVTRCCVIQASGKVAVTCHNGARKKRSYT